MYQRKNVGSISKSNRFLIYSLASLVGYTGCVSPDKYPPTVVPKGDDVIAPAEEPVRSPVASSGKTRSYLDGLLDESDWNPFNENSLEAALGVTTRILLGGVLIVSSAYGINELTKSDGHRAKREIVIITPPPTGGENGGELGGK